MLPSSQRIHRRDFKDIFKKGRFWQSSNLSLVTLKKEDPTLNKSKFAFSASKNVAKKAVARNKLRRRGYSAIRNLMTRVKPSFLAVFIFKKGSDGLSFKEIEKEVVFLLQKSRLL